MFDFEGSGFSVDESVLDSLENEFEGEDLVLSFGTSVETGRKEAASICKQGGRILVVVAGRNGYESGMGGAECGTGSERVLSKNWLNERVGGQAEESSGKLCTQRRQDKKVELGKSSRIFTSTVESFPAPDALQLTRRRGRCSVGDIFRAKLNPFSPKSLLGAVAISVSFLRHRSVDDSILAS